jgi:hypothetical protein
VVQQLREATAAGQGLRFILRDNDGKFGGAFEIFSELTGIEILRTPINAPRANAMVVRYIGGVRRQCLDYLMIIGERQLCRMIHAYVDCFNRSQAHKGIGQNVQCGLPLETTELAEGKIFSLPVLNG